ncbi:MAG: MFS transporter [Devosia sp.]
MLFGSLVGYALTIATLYADSLILLVVGRVITGFIAGNQSIAQAATIDASADAEDRARNMGYIMIGTSIGRVGGPLIGGLLSAPEILGSFANFKLPFSAALTMVVWAISAALFIASPIAWLCFVPVSAFYFVVGVAYPTMLSMFSHSVDDSQQGWVIGMTIVVFTSVGGILSVAGGWLSGLDINLPFYTVIVAALACIVAVRLAWTAPQLWDITGGGQTVKP